MSDCLAELQSLWCHLHLQLAILIHLFISAAFVSLLCTLCDDVMNNKTTHTTSSKETNIMHNAIYTVAREEAENVKIIKKKQKFKIILIHTTLHSHMCWSPI